MDSRENGRYKMDYYKGAHNQRNMMHQHQEPNALAMNKKIMAILTERNAAIQERNIALAQKKEAFAERDEALRQRDEAIAQRDSALMERDSAISALQTQDHFANLSFGSGQHGKKRRHHSDLLTNLAEPSYNKPITNAFPISAISSEVVKSSQEKRAKGVSSATSKPKWKVKNVGEDFNRELTPEGKKYRSEWEGQDVGLNIVNFDETTMPVPVCSCTGVPRQCYKWGNGGWQSSCCTINMSVYPLPQMPNKRHARVGGRKMSGSVFTRLLSRLAANGHDLSVPVDLKDYWARHGTNRYITIK